VRQGAGNGDAPNGRPGPGARGFTLIEALVVVAVLGLLAVVLVFVVGGTEDEAETTSCAAEKKVLQTAEEQYKAASAPHQYPTKIEDLLTDPTKFLRAKPESYTVSSAGDGKVIAIPDGACAK
jgi:prepilin-type N-terminal cleavage/methylation domain-containing protein